MPQNLETARRADGRWSSGSGNSSPKAQAAASERLHWAVRQAGGNKIVAQRSGVPLGTLNNYVRGRHGMKTRTLEALALACNVPLAWIVSGEAPWAAAGDVGDLPQSPLGLGDAPQEPAPTSRSVTPGGRLLVPVPGDGLDVTTLAKAIDIVRGITGTTPLNDPAHQLAQRLAAVYAVLMRSTPQGGA